MNATQIADRNLDILFRFVERQPEWRGSPGNLADELIAIAKPREYPPRPESTRSFFDGTCGSG